MPKLTKFSNSDFVKNALREIVGYTRVEPNMGIKQLRQKMSTKNFDKNNLELKQLWQKQFRPKVVFAKGILRRSWFCRTYFLP